MEAAGGALDDEVAGSGVGVADAQADHLADHPGVAIALGGDGKDHRWWCPLGVLDLRRDGIIETDLAEVGQMIDARQDGGGAHGRPFRYRSVTGCTQAACQAALAGLMRFRQAALVLGCLVSCAPYVGPINAIPTIYTA